MTNDETGAHGTEADEDYFLEIEAHFSERRGTPFIASAKDWALLQGWKGDGIPLSLVLEAIDDCFDKREASGRKSPISSLSYCRHAVEELWGERKTLQVGGQSGAADETTAPSERLSMLVERLGESASRAEAAVRDVVSEAAGRVDALRRRRSVSKIEEELMAIEEDLFRGLIASLPASQLNELQSIVREELAGFAADRDTRERTEQANLRRHLRQMLSLPRLTLFG